MHTKVPNLYILSHWHIVVRHIVSIYAVSCVYQFQKQRKKKLNSLLGKSFRTIVIHSLF